MTNLIEPLVKKLITDEEEVFISGLNEAISFTDARNFFGIAAIRNAIRQRSGQSEAMFFKPGQFISKGLDYHLNAKEEILKLSANKSLLQNVYDSGKLISALNFISDNSEIKLLLAEIFRIGGNSEAFAFQLLFNEMRCTLILKEAIDKRNNELNLHTSQEHIERGLKVSKLASSGDTVEFKNIVFQYPETLYMANENGFLSSYSAAKSGNYEILNVFAEIDPYLLSLHEDIAIWAAGILRKDDSSKFTKCIRILSQYAPTTLSYVDEQTKFTAALITSSDKNGGERLKIISEVAPKTISMPDKDGKYPSQNAASCGCAESLKIISEIAPETLSLGNNSWETPANLAARNGYIGCLKIIAEVAPKSFLIANKDGVNPILHAASHGHKECAELIYSVAPETISLKEITYYAAKYGWEEWIKIIIKKEPDSLISMDEKGYSHILFIAQKGHRKCLELILDAFPDQFTISNKHGESIALWSAENGWIDYLKIFLEKLPSLLIAANPKGYTPALCAADRGHLDCLNLIIEYSPECIFDKTVSGFSIAFCAAFHGWTSILKTIVEQSPSMVSTIMDNGDTLAIAASRNGKADCLKIIAAIAPETLVLANKKGDTPEKISKKNKFNECLKVLKIYLPEKKNTATPKKINVVEVREQNETTQTLESNENKITSGSTERNEEQVSTFKKEHEQKNKWWKFW